MIFPNTQKIEADTYDELIKKLGLLLSAGRWMKLTMMWAAMGQNAKWGAWVEYRDDQEQSENKNI